MTLILMFQRMSTQKALPFKENLFKRRRWPILGLKQMEDQAQNQGCNQVWKQRQEDSEHPKNLNLPKLKGQRQLKNMEAKAGLGKLKNMPKLNLKIAELNFFKI